MDLVLLPAAGLFSTSGFLVGQHSILHVCAKGLSKSFHIVRTKGPTSDINYEDNG
jgi:hypothetical protein